MKILRPKSGTKALLVAACCIVVLPLLSPSSASAEERKLRKKKAHATQTATASTATSTRSRRSTAAPSEEHYGYRQGRSARPVTSTWSTDTPTDRAYVRQDAYGTPRRDGTQQFVTGSLIKQDVNVNGNSADTASPLRIYGQQDLRSRGGGISTAESLRRVDPAISISGH